jgi:hypothetical protein
VNPFVAEITADGPIIGSNRFITYSTGVVNHIISDYQPDTLGKEKLQNMINTVTQTQKHKKYIYI